MPGLVRTTGAGAGPPGLQSKDDIRREFRSLREAFGGRLGAVIIQPAVTDGVEVLISVLQEQVFGPLVLFGIGGAATGVLADRAARLAPLTDSDADELIRSIRAAPQLLGRPGTTAADLVALRDMLRESPRWPMSCRRSPSST